MTSDPLYVYFFNYSFSFFFLYSPPTIFLVKFFLHTRSRRILLNTTHMFKIHCTTDYVKFLTLTYEATWVFQITQYTELFPQGHCQYYLFCQEFFLPIFFFFFLMWLTTHTLEFHLCINFLYSLALCHQSMIVSGFSFILKSYSFVSSLYWYFHLSLIIYSSLFSTALCPGDLLCDLHHWLSCSLDLANEIWDSVSRVWGLRIYSLGFPFSKLSSVGFL